MHDTTTIIDTAPLTPARLLSWRAGAPEGTWLCYFRGHLDRDRSRDVQLNELANFVYRDLYLAGRAVLVQRRLENVEAGFAYFCVSIDGLKPVMERHEETRRR
jgi:hypothetical protein